VLREWGVETPASRRVYAHLEQVGLLEPRRLLGVLLKRASEYVRRLGEAESLETGLALDPGTGQPVGVNRRIKLVEPSEASRAAGCLSVDDLLSSADEALADLGFAVWLVLDRLDVAFVQHDAVEKKALRALFKAYLDMQGLRHVALKLFLRSDLWRGDGREDRRPRPGSDRRVPAAPLPGRSLRAGLRGRRARVHGPHVSAPRDPLALRGRVGEPQQHRRRR